MVLITHVPASFVGIGSNQYSDPLGIAQQKEMEHYEAHAFVGASRASLGASLCQ